jgi:hypothetical protein
VSRTIKLTEAFERCKDNMTHQILSQCMTKATHKPKKGLTEVVFVTDLSVVDVASTKVGIIVWVDRDVLEAVLDGEGENGAKQ